jgi:hypothetical protein
MNLPMVSIISIRAMRRKQVSDPNLIQLSIFDIRPRKTKSPARSIEDMIRTCCACEKPFRAKQVSQRTCSLSCAAKAGKGAKANQAALEKMGLKKWSGAELEKLIELVGEFPFPDLYKAFTAWAEQNGFPIRSECTVKRRISILGFSRKPSFNHWTTGQLAGLLQINPVRVSRWIRKGWLKARKVDGAFLAISAVDFAEFYHQYQSRIKPLNPAAVEAILRKTRSHFYDRFEVF